MLTSCLAILSSWCTGDPDDGQTSESRPLLPGDTINSSNPADSDDPNDEGSGGGVSSEGMPVRKTYGSKRSVALNPSSRLIFAIEDIRPVPSHESTRDSLSELSQLASRLNIEDERNTEEEDETIAVKDAASEEGFVRSGGSSSTGLTYKLNPILEALRADTGVVPQIEIWADILASVKSLEKIAEASFAEVYRATDYDGETSILKVMPLKLSSDPASLAKECYCDVKTIISEIRIMEHMTELPGFVEYKTSHIIRGNPGDRTRTAWEKHGSFQQKRKPHFKSCFPNPKQYTSTSTFLVIELADAGENLEDYHAKTIGEVWDILLLVIIALFRGEYPDYQFEHRDLHENNICVAETSKPGTINPEQDGAKKFGFSGLEVTLIDYGLSRAKARNGEVVFHDLESDLNYFQGPKGKPQFDNYRRMRNHLFTRGRKMEPAEWHNEASKQLSNGRTWADYTPYSNVLWIKYILAHLQNDFKKHGNSQGDFTQFTMDVSELKRRLDTRTKIENGGFQTAAEVFQFVIDQGWITAKQVHELGFEHNLDPQPEDDLGTDTASLTGRDDDGVVDEE